MDRSGDRFYTAETAFRDPRHRDEMLEFFERHAPSMRDYLGSNGRLPAKDGDRYAIDAGSVERQKSSPWSEQASFNS